MCKKQHICNVHSPMSWDMRSYLGNGHHSQGNRYIHHQKFPCVPLVLFIHFCFVHFGFVVLGWEHLTWDLPSWRIFKGRDLIAVSFGFARWVSSRHLLPHTPSLTMLYCPRPVFARPTSQERANRLKRIEKKREITFYDMWEVHEIQIPFSVKFYRNTAVPAHLCKVCGCLYNILELSLCGGDSMAHGA